MKSYKTGVNKHIKFWQGIQYIFQNVKSLF